MTLVGKLLEKWNKIEQGLELSDKRVIIEETYDETVFDSEQECAIVLHYVNTEFDAVKWNKWKNAFKPIINDVYHIKKTMGKYNYRIIAKETIDGIYLGQREI